ncbi:Spc7-domain-containing protein [Polyplosphaeria fusca]|uniref:Spc7-domain-containing protein n=1 Tax=Polyplosphaeria fusca TaxID=682080 RepID=A0A9P4R842_9PLEO|nr:Spc7-domain-containing protein [Polyplosphaeria fusca]
MAADAGKENIADGLMAPSSFSAPSLSPKKSSRRTRSKSIGPGGLDAPDQPALKESTGNRRKSAFIPAVKSILSSNDEDEKKRREARRKSLAKRRVSFAPEATLHTWDVVEYLRDATTSSASSESTRRASTVSQSSAHTPSAPDSDAEEPPSTPPEQAEEPQVQVESSPANQRDLHKKKRRRRSSGIPPMNFNNPDDVFSSSPLSGDGLSPGGGDMEIATDSEEEEESAERLDSSPDTEDSSQSSARLDAALRQAATYASAQQLPAEEQRNVSAEVAEKEITAPFKPWTQKTISTPQPDEDPFSPAPPAPMESDDEDDEEMSMDITKAMGRIVPQQQQEPAPSPDMEDATMDLTMPLGSIQQATSKEPVNRRKSLKRRSSVLDPYRGSPAKRPSRRSSLRHRPQSDEALSPEDKTMDFTLAIGAIKTNPQESQRRASVDTSVGDETMDFTVAVGSIKDMHSTVPGADQISDEEIDEELSMEFTNIIGGIKNLSKPQALTTPDKPQPGKTKTPTPRKSPAKLLELRQSPKAQATPQKSPGKPQLSPRMSPGRPRKNMDPATPEGPIVSEHRINSHHQQSPAEKVSTPTNQIVHTAPREIPEDPIAAPILNRRRSSLSLVQFSPLAATREEPVLKSTALLSNNIKLLSTPRKQTLASPTKRGLTPKKSETPQKVATPKQKTPTQRKTTIRKSNSPKKRVAFGEEPSVPESTDVTNEEPEEEVERISLQEFLDMTKIRFMDLSTTKRRHTAAPSAFHDKEVEEGEDSLGRYVVAGACTLPEYELYQHACHEMKKYISDGRHFVRTVEENVMEENPMLFSEYVTAPPDQRNIMDNQFKNLKTSARLDARGEWYSWRSTLLGDLKAGLLGTMDGFRRDEKNLSNQESLLDIVLPPLVEKHQALDVECKQLQQRHDELNSCDREELEQTREQLVSTDAGLAETRELLARLKGELADKEARIEAAKERKIECLEQIKAAERVREECRGWSTQEVNELKGKVMALEQAYGWTITSATSTTITMTHESDLELFFTPSAFATGANTPNASISLTYVGDSATPHPRPLTTSKRFFLQLMRAHVHCIPQSQTRISQLLSVVKKSWTSALAVAEGVRWLQHTHVTDECILSDERMAISSSVLLACLQTKIRATFEIGVCMGEDGVEAQVDIEASLVYGEKYNADKMGAFLRDFCGAQLRSGEEMGVWADAVADLVGRLVATGRKGERAH